MAKFRGAELVCLICGAKFRVPPSRADKATTCSHECSVKYRAQGLMREKVEFLCSVCGITFFEHKSRAGWRRFCSNRCRENSAQYQLEKSIRSIGALNGNWRGGETPHPDGYIYESVYDHPFASGGRVLQHRLVAERNLVATNHNSPYLIRLGHNLYLDPELVVHHKNEDKQDNRVENLQIMTNSDHQRLHNLLRRKSA